MTWANVVAKIEFHDGVANWGVTIGQLDSNQEEDILEALEALYNGSPTAADALEAAVASSNLKIGASPSTGPGRWYTGTNIVAFNFTAISSLRYMNNEGTYIAEIPAITFIHEILHAVIQVDDPSSDESYLNSSTSNHRGSVVAEQNAVALEMGWTDNYQVSYHAAMSASDSRYGELTLNQNYTNGADVDIARFGRPGEDDNLDHDLRTTLLRDLFFGFDGEDTISAGAGNDHAYGGDGDDIIDGGDDNDRLYGEDDFDQIAGGAGNDLLDGGGGDDILDGGAGDDTFKVADVEADEVAGGADDDLLQIEGDVGAMVSVNGAGSPMAGAILVQNVETIVGGDGYDLFYLPASGSGDIDGGAGGNGVSFYFAASGITIDIPAAGAWTAGGYTLANIEASFEGTDFDDVISSARPMDLAGGGGADTISGSGVATWLLGGDGDDVIYADDGASLIDGGSGADTLNIDGAIDPFSQYEGIEEINATSENDYVVIDEADTTVWTRSGNDTVVVSVSNGNIGAILGSGGDTLIWNPTGSANEIYVSLDDTDSSDQIYDGVRGAGIEWVIADSDSYTAIPGSSYVDHIWTANHETLPVVIGYLKVRLMEMPDESTTAEITYWYNIPGEEGPTYSGRLDAFTPFFESGDLGISI